MHVKKTTGYIVGAQKSNARSGEKDLKQHHYRIIKTGRVLTLREDAKSNITKNVDVASMANQGRYYQVISNQGACGKCEAHNGAIYSVAEAKEGVNLPPFHPNCKCIVRAYNPANPNYDPWKGEAVAWRDAQNSNSSREEKIAMLSSYYGFTLQGELLEQLEDLYGPLVDCSRSFFNRTYLMAPDTPPSSEMIRESEAVAKFNAEIEKLLRKRSSFFLNVDIPFSQETHFYPLKQLHNINQRQHQSHEDYVNSVIWLFNRLPDAMQLILGYQTGGREGLGETAINIIVDSTHVSDLIDGYTATPDKNLRESTATMSFFNFNDKYKYLMKNESRANAFVQLLDTRIEEIKSGSEYSVYERQVIISMLTEVRELNINHTESYAVMNRGIDGWIRISR